jgi:2-desacetyl-2-hydroxyethyl bacteriochlorophyllide A dehydrogenase
MTSIETSVIIRTFNEARHLPTLFDVLDRQSYDNFETIVVDSGSFDNTRNIAKTRADKVFRISSHDFTFGYSLNYGIERAEGRFIAIVSAHTIPADENWLEKLIEPLRSGNTAMSYGRQLGVRSSRFGEAEDFDRYFGPLARTESNGSTFANNANSALPKELWNEHSFDETLLGLEDIAWARHWMEKGRKVIYEPSASIYHTHEETWTQIRRRYYREAVAARRIGILALRNIPRLLIKEAICILADMISSISGRENPVCQRLSGGQRFREILYFRLHKNLGTIRGLLEPHPIETKDEMEDILFERSARSVVIHGPRKAALETHPMPKLKPGDALVQVAYTAVCATDLEVATGSLGYFKNGLGEYPIVPGHEFSGRIVAVGQNVDGLQENDAVVVECIQGCGSCAECRNDNAIGCEERTEVGVLRHDGAYAEYMISPARFIHKLPMDIDLRSAALIEPLAVTLKGLRRLETILELGNSTPKCAVVGAGPLGHLVAKVLSIKGYSVTAFDRNPKRLAQLEGSKINQSQHLNNLSGFGAVVEVTGDPEVLDQVLHQTPANAALLLLGLPYGRRGFSFETVAAYDKTIVGSVGSTKRDFEAAIKLLPQLDLSPYFKCEMALEDFEEAWKISRSGDVLKVMLAG